MSMLINPSTILLHWVTYRLLSMKGPIAYLNQDTHEHLIRWLHGGWGHCCRMSTLAREYINHLKQCSQHTHVICILFIESTDEEEDICTDNIQISGAYFLRKELH